jgi:8-oxo-dGTP pyrophosphatase MutT (NUDIX family)
LLQALAISAKSKDSSDGLFKTMSGPKEPVKTWVQYAALPFRRREGLGTEVMLVTSRRTRRWIIPKGWPIGRRTPHASAAKEALEEAGVVGRIGKSPIGSYSYEKLLKKGETIVCEVLVFPLEVKRQQKSWPEKGSRQIRWLSPARAAATVQERDLSDIIRKLQTDR